MVVKDKAGLARNLKVYGIRKFCGTPLKAIRKRYEVK